MMYWVRQLHMYAGIVLSVLVFVLALSGAMLIYKNEYWRWNYPELDREDVIATADAQARVIRIAAERYGSRLLNVKMPEPGVPAYHLYLEDGEAFLSLDGTRWIDQWGVLDRPMSLLFDLHAHLMAGEAGEKAGGVISLAAALMVLTGLVLWYPVRREFSFANLWPRDLSRGVLLRWHRDAGLILSPLLLVLLLTGGGLVFYAQAQKILNGAFGDPLPSPEPPAPAAYGGFALPDGATLERVAGHFPGSRLVFYYPVDDGDGLNAFRVKQPCELHPNGRTFIYTDARTGQVHHAVDACALPPGERMVHAFYPLHAAKTGSGIYKFLAFVGSLVLAGLALTGLVTYLVKLRRGHAAPRRNAVREAA